MPLNEEKKLLTQIKELSRSREDVRQLQELQTRINDSEARQTGCAAPTAAHVP